MMAIPLERIRSALAHVPVGGHDERIRIAFALKSELGNEGFDLWDSWYRERGTTYDPTESKAVWKSARPDGKVNIGTLFYEARGNGWRDDGAHLTLTPAQIEAQRRENEERDAQAEANQRARQESAREQAADILEAATDDPQTHPYAAKIKKGIPIGPRVKRGPWPQRGWPDALLIPVFQPDGRAWSVEAINVDGKKDTLKDSKTAGGFHHFGKITGAHRVLIGEGIATTAVGHDADGSPAMAARFRGNLKAVGELARKLAAPNAQIVFMADNDPKDDGTNPGIETAIEAARSCGGVVAVTGVEGKSDFWDLWAINGSDAVRAAIEKALQAPQSGTAASTPSPTTANAKAADSDGWQEPLPLPDSLLPVAAFDFALMPATLKPWAKDICERVQCAPDFVAAAIMAGLGSIIGRKLGIRPQARTDWTVTPNQWALVVGRPGVLKSPAIEAALAPIKRLAAVANEAHQADMEQHRIALRMAKLAAEEGDKSARKQLAKLPGADVSHLLGTEEPETPALRRYIAVNSNAASLGELHRQNHNGLLVHRDELVSLLRSLDREDQAEAREFYLTGWNGDSSYTFDRIGRGLNLHIPAVCLSLLGSTQPGRIADYVRHAVRGGAGDDGLIQRFGLLVWPDTGGEWRDVDRLPDSTAKKEAHRVFDYLDKLDPETVGALQDTNHDGEPDGIPYLRFDERALGLFLEWRTNLESRLRAGDLHPALESHLAKYRKLVPSLALILHLANNGTGPVTERAALQALAWAEYLETHARRAYGSVTAPEVAAAKAIISRIRKGDLKREFSSREVWRPGWAMLSDREQVADALRLLVDYDWLATTTNTDTGGRPATTYIVNPRGFQS